MAHSYTLSSFQPKGGFGQMGGTSRRGRWQPGIFCPGSHLPAYRGVSAFFSWRSQHLSVTLSLENSGSSLSLYLFSAENHKASLLLLGPDILPPLAAFAFANRLFIKLSLDYSTWMSSLSWQYLTDTNPHPQYVWWNLICLYCILKNKQAKTIVSHLIDFTASSWAATHSWGNNTNFHFWKNNWASSFNINHIPISRVFAINLMA